MHGSKLTTEWSFNRRVPSLKEGATRPTRKGSTEMADTAGIKIINGALDEWKIPDDPEPSIVLRGTIVPASLADLSVAEYQRETLSNAKVLRLVEVLRTGRVPDIELGMRGERLDSRGSNFTLHDQVFIVDGLQRTTAALRLMELDPTAAPHLGATIHFNTTEEWERKRFDDLNLGQTRLSPNVTLRNLRHGNPAAEALYNLTTNPRSVFVLRGKVSWEQNMKRSELITASVYFKSIGVLHSHIGPGRRNNVVDLSKGLEQIMKTAGRNIFLGNVRLFYQLIDELWGVQTVAYKASAIQLKQTFLLALARLFSEHLDFWDGNTLKIDAPLKRKLATFPINDPAVMNLASSGGSSANVLVQLMTDHINHGKRTRRLRRRRWAEPTVVEIDSTEEA